jgi:hydroxymethylpyrimidine pyrophosphatase-like HAD family hydrolase
VPTVDLVVTDLDGTLWAHEGLVHDRVLQAWSAITAAGVPILVATGRREKSTAIPLAAFGLVPPAVLLDGAIGIDLATARRFHTHATGPVTAKALLATFNDHGLSPVVYVDSPRADVFVSTAPSTHPGHLALFGSDARVGDLDEVVATETVLAFGLVGVDCAAANAVAAAVVEAGLGEARVNPSFDFGGCALTVVAPGLSKWDGVVAYCAGAGIDPGRLLAIGDGSNDVELLTNASVSCSLEGSSAVAIDAADHLVGPVGSGGWADIVAYI